MSHRIEPIRMEDVAELEAYVKHHRSVGILKAAEDLGWSAIKVLNQLF